MGDRKQARDRIQRVVDELFPLNRSRTEVERKLVDDFRTLANCGHLTSTDLGLIAAMVRHIKAVIDEQANSN